MLDDEAFQGMRDTVFRRLTGVKKATFLEMQSVLEAAEKPEVFCRMADLLRQDEQARRLRGGFKKRQFSVEDRLLMMLEYLREYLASTLLAPSNGLKYSLRDTETEENDSVFDSLLLQDFTMPISLYDNSTEGGLLKECS